MNFIDFIKESKLTANIDAKDGKKVLALASKLKHKDEFRAFMESKIPGIENIPKISSRSLESSVNQLNSYSHNKSSKLLLSYAANGIGAGEVYLAYVVDDVVINGGSSTYDLNIGSDKYEVKMNEVSKSKIGFCAGSEGISFRYGTVLKSFIAPHMKDINNLLKFLAIADPRFKAKQNEYLERVNRGEIGANIIGMMADTKVDLSSAPIKITIDKKMNIIFNNEIISNLNDKKHTEILKGLSLSNKITLKSVQEINDEMQDSLTKYHKSSGVSFVFIDHNTLKFYVMGVMSGKIKSITGNQMSFVAEV